MKMLVPNRLGGQQKCQITNTNANEVRLGFSIGRLLIIIFLLVPLSACVSLDDLTTGESWLTSDDFDTTATQYIEPAAMSPLASDEIVSSNETFKSLDFSLTIGSYLPSEQIDLHKANLLSLLTNNSSRGSAAPWEGSIKLGQQIPPTTSTWVASLEPEYQPNLPIELDYDYVRAGALAIAWNNNYTDSIYDPQVNENDNSAASKATEIVQAPLGMSSGLTISTSNSTVEWSELISTIMRWIAMVFLAVVLLIPIGCSYTAKLVGKHIIPPKRRRSSDDCAPSSINSTLSNVAAR